MKIGVFLKTMSDKKNYLLKDMAAGIPNSFLSESMTYEECDIAVMMGYPNATINHANDIKHDILKNHKGPTVHIDGHLFRHSLKEKYYRVSFNSVYYNDATYYNDNSPSDRWNRIGSKLVKPWRDDSKSNILVLMQRKEGWMMQDLDPTEWLLDTVRKIRNVSNRPIIVKPHPATPLNIKLDFNDVTVFNTTNYDFKECFENDCWCVVTHNSSGAIDAIVDGLPVFLTDSNCLANPMCNFDINDIDNPVMPDRTQWFNNIGYVLWTRVEMRKGLWWNHVSKFL